MSPDPISFVELLDLFPTFCDLAGLPAPATRDGKSFLPLLKDPQAEGKPGEFCSTPPGWGSDRTVRTKRWRLVERLDGPRELYDHSTDMAEYYNVLNNPEHELLIKRLHAMLEQEFGPLPKPACDKNTRTRPPMTDRESRHAENGPHREWAIFGPSPLLVASIGVPVYFRS